ncbi:MAG: HemK/PrmC family methyltransferase [Patescibacteria group bacterium]
MTQNQRVFTPYEQTLLARAGLSHLTPEDVGHQPIEYVVGWVEFCGLKFKVNPTVLIPRIETERLVELVMANVQKKLTSLKPGQRFTVADIGTGSGAIGISLMKRLGQANQKIQLFLSDISPKALAVAKINAQNILSKSIASGKRVCYFGNLHNSLDVTSAGSSIHLIQSNLLDSFPPQVKIDLLIANLPYIPSGRIDQLDPSVKNFEPHLALDGGPDGLRLINRLLCQAPDFLVKDGVIWLEIDESHTLAQLKNIAPSFEVQIFEDEFDKPRFAKLK